jgi:hypothetical protein
MHQAMKYWILYMMIHHHGHPMLMAKEFSLHSATVNPSGDPGDYSYWTLSVVKDGTPFADNVLSEDEDPDPPGTGALVVYPNPTSGIITVLLDTDDAVEDLEIMVFTTTGKIVKHKIIGNPGLLDLSESGLPSGMYILKIIAKSYSARKAIILIK